MTVVRFAVLTLCAVGLAACAYAGARLIGWIPPGKLPPYPGWVAIHFIASTLFCLVAPLQLWTTLRTRRPALHRAMGRFGVGLGAIMAVSGLLMVNTIPGRPISEIMFMTFLFGVYGAFLGLGVRAAMARDFEAHRAWMVRMTAIALTPMTQRLIFPILAGSVGIDGLDTFWQLFVSAAWLAVVANMTTAEWWLRRATDRRPFALS
jgi:uncharacterized membrane protein